MSPGPTKGTTGRLIEATDDIVVFAPASRLPATLRPIAATLSIAVIPPFVELVWAPRSYNYHVVFGLFLPYWLFLVAWSTMLRDVVAWSRIAPPRAPFRLQRLGPGPIAAGPSATGASAPTFAVQSPGRTLGPDRRRGAFQLRVYEDRELDIGEEAPTAGRIAENPTGPLGELADYARRRVKPPGRARKVMVATVVVIGEEAFAAACNVSPVFSPTVVNLEAARAAVALSTGSTRTEHTTQDSMLPLAQALFRVLQLPSGAARAVPRLRCRMLLSSPTEALMFTYLPAVVWLVAYWNMVMAADRGAPAIVVGISVAIAALQAALYVSLLRRRYLDPLNALVEKEIDAWAVQVP